MLMKRIEVLMEMIKEPRPEVEQHIINEEIVKLYREKIAIECNERMKADDAPVLAAD